MAETYNHVGPFIIRELGGAARALILRGRALPYRPLEREVQQRISSTMLPGYSRRTITLLGPEEPSMRIGGKWKDKYLAKDEASADGVSIVSRQSSGNDFLRGDVAGRADAVARGNEDVPMEWAGERVNSVREAVEIVTMLCRTGTFVEVSWDTLAWHGVIKRFRNVWHTTHDLEWEIEFEWEGLAETPGEVSPSQEASMSQSVSSFEQLTEQLKEEALSPFAMANEAIREITQGVKRIADTTQRLSDTIANVAQLVMTPAAALRQMTALFLTIRGQCDALILTLVSSVPGSQGWSGASTNPELGLSMATNPGGTLTISKLSFVERLRAASYVREVISVLREMQRQALEQQLVYVEKLEKDVLMVYQASEGEDLRDVSSKFYDTPFEWRRIMVFNGLSTPALSAGQLVQVPKLNTAQEVC